MAGRSDSLVALFRELAQLTVLDEGSPNAFRVRAYENAVEAISSYRGDLGSLSEKELTAIAGIGPSTARKIREFFQSGTIAKLEELRRKYPPDFVELGKIPGLGPKTLLRLRSELGVRNLEDLRAALEGKKVREIRGLGEKMEEKLLHALDRQGAAGKDKRRPIAEAMPIARELVAALEALPAVERAQYCGSLRRLRETVADVDIVAASREPSSIRDAFVKMPTVLEVIGSGDTKTSVLTTTGLQVDPRIVEPAQFGAACQYFTGSKAHNIKLRQRALARGWLLNEYGLSDAQTGEVIAQASEEAIYRALGLPLIAPPVREDRGEIEQAEKGGLPPPVRLEDVRGDLHVHTALSGDGKSLLHGSELNIDRDGRVDYDPAFRRTLDWCVAGVHSHFDLERAQQTRRILAAMEDPTVHALAHLTGRRIGTRAGIELEVDAVLQKAVETGTAIEINAAPPRLDASSEVLFRARGMDLTFVINTDTHHTREFARMEWGVLQATRGWVDPSRIANLWPRERFLGWLGAL